MNCTYCNKPIAFWTELNKLPTYFVGKDPASIEKATQIFCGPKCSLGWYEDHKDENEKNSKR